MSLRPKTVQRLIVLTAATSVIAGGLGLAVYLKNRAADRQFQVARETGLTDFRAGEFGSAVPSLRKALTAFPKDVELLSALGISLASGGATADHLTEARTWLQQTLAYDPNNLQARQAMLRVNDRIGLPAADLLAQADTLLAAKPDDADALRARAVALTRLGRAGESLDAWQSYNRVKPADFEAQVQTLAVMRRLGRTSEQLIEHATQVAAANPGNNGYRLPLAMVYLEIGDRQNGLAVLDNLAAGPATTDKSLAKNVVKLFEQAQAYDQAESLIRIAFENHREDTELASQVAVKLWQRGDLDALLAATEKLPVDAEPAFVSARVAALVHARRHGEIEPLIVRLEQDRGDEIARAWATALRVRMGDRVTLQERIKGYRDALSLDRKNAFAAHWLAESLVEAGETDDAMDHWRTATRLSISWADPFVGMSRALLASGRFVEAEQNAEQAVARSPRSPVANLQLAECRLARLDASPDAEVAGELLARVEAWRSQFADRSELVPIHVDLLARTGKAEAAKSVALRYIEQSAAPDPATFARLIRISDRFDLNVESELFDRAEAMSLMTPTLALKRATRGAEQNAAAARKTFDALAAGRLSQVDWRLADARLAASLGEPTAAQKWRGVGETFTGDPQVQASLLREGTALIGDRAFTAATIERLRVATGDDALGWRQARVEWLLQSDAVDDAREASNVATQLVSSAPQRNEFRLLLARALEKCGSVSTAVEHAHAAFAVEPNNPAIALEYARLLRVARRGEDAVGVLIRLARFDQPDSADQFRVAATLIDAGLTNEATDLLHRGETSGVNDEASSVLLAQSLSASGRRDDARAIYARLLKSDAPADSTLAAAAGFFRNDRDGFRANELLSRLRKRPDSRSTSLALARYEASGTDVSAAVRAYEMVLMNDISAAREAIGFAIDKRQHEMANAWLAEATRKFGNDPALARLSVEARLASSGTNELPALIDALRSDPEHQLRAATLNALDVALKHGRPTTELADSLAALAREYSSSMPLQIEAVRANLSVGKFDSAMSLAGRALQREPDDATLLDLSARSALAAGRLKQAEALGERWRRSSPDAIGPRLLLAQVDLRNADPADAMKQLEPFIEQYGKPEADPGLTVVMSAALARTGKSGEVFEKLKDEIESSPAARVAWTDAIGFEPDLQAASTRLETLTRLTPVADADQVRRLAIATIGLVNRGGAETLASRTVELTAPLAAIESPPADDLLLCAELYRLCGRFDEALSLQRTAVDRFPNHAAAHNALAFQLLTRNTDLDRARTLAARAVELEGRVAAHRDTLARIELARGAMDAAESQFRAALDVDSDYLDSMIGLANLHAARGRSDRAQMMLERIERTMKLAGTEAVPPHLRLELTQLRQSLTGAD
jgi:tetratricopeptide (TPR) repeat protein